MKTWLLSALLAALTLALVPVEADAKRLGGGRSSGMQRDMPARTAPDAAPAKPAAPAQQATPAQQAGPTNAAAPATPPKRSWLGPIAGLAAGLGLAALMSHLGLGEGFAQFLTVALLALAAFFVVRLLLRRLAPQREPAGLQYASASGGGMVAGTGGSGPALTSGPAQPPVEPQSAPPAAAVATPPARAFVPASFDAEGFARTAKMIFIRLQAANDTRDLDDLRAFTTPEMFAELSLDIQERGSASQRTEVLKIDTEVLDLAQDETRQIVSVRFTGDVREQEGANPVAVNEVWHLVKPLDGSRSWAIAGIEQLH